MARKKSKAALEHRKAKENHGKVDGDQTISIPIKEGETFDIKCGPARPKLVERVNKGKFNSKDIVEFNGKTLTVGDHIRALGVSMFTIRHRVNVNGMSYVEALSVPVRKKTKGMKGEV